MVNSEQIVYDLLNDNLEDILITTDANLTPATFPCITVEEIDNFTPTSYFDGANNDNYSAVSVQIDIYTMSKANGGGKKAQARSIFESVDAILTNAGFRRTMASPVSFAENTKYRFTIRYNALISNDLQIYRR